jgi:hypothetical protein
MRLLHAGGVFNCLLIAVSVHSDASSLLWLAACETTGCSITPTELLGGSKVLTTLELECCSKIELLGEDGRLGFSTTGSV